MTDRTLLLLHGYSDDARSFENSWIPILTGTWTAAKPETPLGAKLEAWKSQRAALMPAGFDFSPYARESILPITYESLVDEITIDDIAEGLHLLLLRHGLDPSRPFDAIVHSTGMLVLRAWLTHYPQYRSSLKHIVGIAPASYGSPLAHKGHSWLARAFKGNHELGPDFLQTGARVLDALELGSRFTWDLAHRDLFSTEKDFYGAGPDKPYLFTVCGLSGYDGLERVVNEPGTDGTVRRAGVALDSVKLRAVSDANGKGTLSLVSDGADTPAVRLTKTDNHTRLLVDPSVEAVAAVLEALAVESVEAYRAWGERSDAAIAAVDPKDRWQQIVVGAVDDRGKPIHDYDVHIEVLADPPFALTDDADVDVHAYRLDTSLRCFHLNHARIEAARVAGREPSIRIELTAATQTQFVAFLAPPAIEMAEASFTGASDTTPFFQPFSTLLIEVVFDRRPTTVDTPTSIARVDWRGFTPIGGAT